MQVHMDQILKRTNNFEQFLGEANKSAQDKSMQPNGLSRRSFSDLNMAFLAKVVMRTFVMLVLVREISVLPLLMTRFTEGFLGFASLKNMADTTLFGSFLVAVLTRILEDQEDPNMKSALREEGIVGQMKAQRPPRWNPLIYFMFCQFNQPSVTIFLLFDRIFSFGSMFLGRYLMRKQKKLIFKYVHGADLYFMLSLNEKFKSQLAGVNQVYDPMTGQLFLSDIDNKLNPVPHPPRWTKSCNETLVRK